jgi:BirA family biotin operon repressor/biotin-[acetyl-CoA-carboxylase] ligase
MSDPDREPRIVSFETIDSTNAEAHRRAAAGERGPLWIIAGRQEAGRGRSGRDWSSPAGNLSATLLFTPSATPAACYHHVSFLSAVAVWDALIAGGADEKFLQLKWPNDLMLAGAKLGGILVESSRYDGDDVIIVGIGVNLAVSPPVPGRSVTHLSALGPLITPADLLSDLAPAMTRWLAIWRGGSGFDAIRAAWLERAHPPGQSLSVKTHDTEYRGTFEGLDVDGGLRLRTAEGNIMALDHGDVALITASASDDR